MSTTRIDLPGEAWAELRDADTVPERHTRAIGRLRQKLSHSSPEFIEAIVESQKDGAPKLDIAKALASLTPEGYDASEEMNDAMIVALVTAWSFEGIPITTDGVLDLPGPAYKALLKVCAEHGKTMILDTEPTADPESPTEP